MEPWFLVAVSACVCVLIRAIITNFTSTTHGPRLPPGPPFIPVLTTISWLAKSFSQFEPVLVGLRAKYGPIITLRITSRPAIFVADRSIAHQALVQKGAVFSDRPPALAVARIFTCNQHDINSSPYGSTWRTLRRNLTSEMLHPNRVKSFSSVRRWVLDVLVNRLKSDSESGNSVRVIDHFHYAMFCLLVFMCFGEKLDEKQVKDVERVERALLLSTSRFNILNFWEPITRILFRKRWQELFKLMKDQSDVLIPLIRARKTIKEHRSGSGSGGGGDIVSYVDTLLDLELPEEKRKLNDEELVTVCSEFLSAGTDTTATALQWIMANVVKYPHVQQRLLEEIREVKGDGESKEEVKEEELQRMPYLKAVVLEGLRRHPPGHFVLPHTVTEDVELNGYLIPKKGSVNFMVAQIGWDPEVWEDPMEFKPERFLEKEKEDGVPFDITGSKEIKMMPFGAGRRICPGFNLAMLHLEYFVANLVWNFDMKVPEGGSVDLTETQEFTIVMKNPLQAHITPRI
ncbi:hypothetical protein PIB30_095405 [Stylosanthes scabra]|uniref:Cytochrome P450 89A2-like n=2 Tax=Stylosanthes scabra TaxID=79078 RepID=A0ABU6ZUH9_9FABA|nr:hypothetical protein [Stylosanthes scabra]